MSKTKEDKKTHLHAAILHIILGEEFHANNSKKIISNDDDNNGWHNSWQQNHQSLEDVPVSLSHSEES